MSGRKLRVRPLPGGNVRDARRDRRQPKRSKTKEFAILDSVINHLGGLPALGRIPKGMIATEILSAGDDGATDVVGPLCAPLD